MKYRDFLEMQTLFRKPKKEKRELSLKDLMKFEKELEEFNEWRKKSNKDDKSKDDTWWGKLSVFQKAFYMTMFGPILGALWLLMILKVAILIGQSVGLK